MESTRIKVKIGEHEFEAEGPTEVVQSQFETFKQLIANPPQQINSSTKPPAKQEQNEIRNVSQVNGRVVSLTVKPDSEATAAMLIMLGQKIFRENDTVTASEIKDGLEQSGYRLTRVDRTMQPLCDDGDVIRIGARKGTRYRFTNQGAAKALNAAIEASQLVKA
jgi:hypothetical protein